LVLPYIYLLSIFISLIGIISKQLRLTIFINLFLFLLLFSLRDIGDIKNDLDDYLTFFDSINRESLLDSLLFNVMSYKGDYIFYFFAWIFKKIYNNFNFYLGAQFLVSYLLFLYGYINILNFYQLQNFAKVKNKYIYLILLLVWTGTASFYFMFGNVLRQGLSIALFIIAIYMFLSNRMFWFYLYSLLSFFSHKSILLLILLVMIYHYYRKYSKKLFITFTLFFTFILFFIFTYFNIWGFFSKVVWYLDHMRHIPLSHLFQVSIMVMLSMFIMTIIKNKYIYIPVNFEVLWYLYIVVGIIIIFSFYFTPELSQRFMLNYFTLQFILFSLFVINLFRNANFKTIGLLLSACALYIEIVVLNPSVNSLFVFN